MNKHFESSQKLRKDGIGKLHGKYAVKLHPMILVVNLYILLVYCCTMLLNSRIYFCCQPMSYVFTLCLFTVVEGWCTLNAGSIMNYVLFLFTPHFQNLYIWNTVWNRVFILNYVIWSENEYLKHSTEHNSHFIKLWYLKWKGVDRDRTLHLLGLNWEADFSWYSWSNTVLWLVS